LFGGNYVAQNGGKCLLFRKSRAKTPHHSDRVAVLTGKYLEHLGALVEAMQDCT
jgi:hypothetical protein